MCKVMIFTNTTKIKSLKKVTNEIAALMSSSERDGFGYVVQGEKGLFGERSLEIEDFDSDLSSSLLDLPFLVQDYNRIGMPSKLSGAGLFHGRTSTNHKTLINTHPILKHGWALIHNGVVNNHGPDYEKITSNDTEHLIHYMANHGVKGIEQHITGYYAIGALDPKGRLHIIKDATATLCMAYISTIDSYVFATNKDLILDLCKDMSWKHSRVSTVNDNVYLIFQNNELISQETIRPRGSTYNENRWAEKSLGRVIDMTEPLDQDEKLFLEEVKLYADRTYTFIDFRGNHISLAEFLEMSDDEKVCCTVVRPDGTVVDPNDYHTDKLFAG